MQRFRTTASRGGRFTGLILFVALSALSLSLRAAPTTAPTSDELPLQLRAQNAFNTGDWPTAIPLLNDLRKKLAAEQPDRVPAIDEQIRVAQRSLATGAPPPKQVETSDEKRIPHQPPDDGEVLSISIKELGNFNFDQENGGNIPADVKSLSGCRIKLTGFMIPMDQADSITSFALVPDLFSCCFGQPPQLQHTVIARTARGKAVSYYPDEIAVEGTLNVEEKKEDGFIVSVFEVDVSSVKPTTK